MERFAKRRFAALLPALLLAISSILPTVAAAATPAGSVSFTEVDPPEGTAPPPYHLLAGDEPQAVSDEPIRVLIVLEKPSLLEEGYEATDLADDAEAQACNAELEQYQADVIAAIEAATREPLDVVWRLTVIADLLSAWVRPAQIETIAAVPGVRSVQEEAVVYPMETGEPDGDAGPGGQEPFEDAAGGDGPADDVLTAGAPAAEAVSDGPAANGEIGDPADDAVPAGDPPAGETGGADEPAAQILEPDWETDYTGAGQRIAIIDTGTDEWHRSLNSSAWMHALSKNAEFNGEPLETYLSALPLLDETGVEKVLGSLTITQQHKELLEGDSWKKLVEHGEAATVGVGADVRSLRKIAFGANYSDRGLSYDIAHHERDPHGSHVAGIAAANRYLPTTECWDPETGKMISGKDPTYELTPEVSVLMENDDPWAEPETRSAIVQGQAPDAQLLVMQVFGDHGAPESNYMAAIQDALLLGADTVNLSLGSNEAGASFDLTPEFQTVVDSLTAHGVIVAMAYGNSSYWSSLNSPGNRNRQPELLYADDVSFATGGKPATYDTAFAVASATVGSDGKVRMSDFSSWGVPSTLELKPEITAPGERIASLMGAREVAYQDPDDPGADSSNVRHDNYMESSGTSMAAPQIAGMAALVMEHLKSRHPDWEGARLRQVAQSLLMSTAVPMDDPDAPVDDSDDPKKNYYSVMQQGAGLVDVKKAVTADAYLTMEGNAVFRPRTADDGKVKAELGASDSGMFIFSFTVHNLDPDASHDYRLRTDLFTQAPTFLSDGTTRALSTGTTPLLGDVQYSIDGKSIDPYDLFTVEVGGTVTVTVIIQIDDPAALDKEIYPSGIYVEGYTWVEEQDEESDDRDVHSIPLLGFYGNWSDASMFEHSTYYDWLVMQAAGGTLKNVPCGPRELYEKAADAVRPAYGTYYDSELLRAQSAATGSTVSLAGNPWFLEPAFPMDLMAINQNDVLDVLQVMFIRNAIADMEIVQLPGKNGTGPGTDPLWQADSCYVYAQYQFLWNWYPLPTKFPAIGKSPQSLRLAPGDRFALRVAAMPEYYWQTNLMNWPKSAPLRDWDMRDVLGLLGKGALREYPLWVDSGEGPDVYDVKRDGNRFTAAVQDDLYTAWVTVLDTDFAPLPNVDGSNCVPNLDEANRPDEPGKVYNAAFTFPADAVPEQFIIMVGDYAGNARYYLVDTAGSEPPVQVTPPPPTPTPTPTPSPAPVPTAPSGAVPYRPAADRASNEPARTPTAAPSATPAPAVSQAPRTADDLPLTVLYVVLGGSAAGLLVLYIVWRRRRK